MRGAGRRVALVGLRCSGKSSVGRALARRLAWSFADLDEVLADGWSRELARSGQAGGTAGELLARHGEPAFRERERDALAELLERPEPLVLATGAGCVESPESVRRLRQRARVAWLVVPLDELARRLRADPTPRPPLLLDTGPGPDVSDPPAAPAAACTGGTSRERAAAELPRLARRREALYRACAGLELDCGTHPVDWIVEELVAWLEGWMRSGETAP